MQQLQYDINTYLTSVKMSSRIRVLVEGKDDKSHVSNIVSLLCRDVKFIVDMAINIKGICAVTCKNNRAKIEKAHEIKKGNSQYDRLVFLCDREIRGYTIDSEMVKDNVDRHYVDGKLSWTMGHSIENYFLDPHLLACGLRHLTSSSCKNKAIELFTLCFSSMIKMIAKLTLAASKSGSASYPTGVIGWRNIAIDSAGNVSIDFSAIENPLIIEFERIYNGYETSIEASSLDVCIRLCRGHTAIIMIKRVFSACLFYVLDSQNDENAVNEANIFDGLSESNISNSLSEAWISRIILGNVNYPDPLVKTIELING